MKRLLLSLAVLTAFVAPSLADPFRPSMRDQIELGKRAQRQIEEEEKVLGDRDRRVLEVRRIGARLVAQFTERQRRDRPFPYSFNVIENDELNAFALPGGPVYLYTGLLDRLTTEDAVAGILAHEIIHVQNQHWASAYADNTKRQLGIAVVLTLLGAGDMAFDVAAVSDALLFTLPYSRRHETEADTQGFDLMVKAGYNPGGLLEVFEVLKKNGGGGGAEWLSTHPDTQRRLDAIEKRINDARVQYPALRPWRGAPPKRGKTSLDRAREVLGWGESAAA